MSSPSPSSYSRVETEGPLSVPSRISGISPENGRTSTGAHCKKAGLRSLSPGTGSKSHVLSLLPVPAPTTYALHVESTAASYPGNPTTSPPPQRPHASALVPADHSPPHSSVAESTTRNASNVKSVELPVSTVPPVCGGRVSAGGASLPPPLPPLQCSASLLLFVQDFVDALLAAAPADHQRDEWASRYFAAKCSR